MSNYDDLLREKEKDDVFDNTDIEKHWAALERKFDAPAQPVTANSKLLRRLLAVAAVLSMAFVCYTFLREKEQQPGKTIAIKGVRSAIIPPLKGTDVPYETFSFNAATGDTLFTLNGSIIIFPAHAVLTGNGEKVSGNIEVRSREFNDPFDYSIAGIPMHYDSAGKEYKFISSGMIDISAYQNGEQLQVNPAAKPQLNLVSTNKEQQTNLYQLDTVTGQWTNKGRDEVNAVQTKNTEEYFSSNNQHTNKNDQDQRANGFPENERPVMPAPPQKASDRNPVIDVIIDPASFKELLVYNGLKFEVLDAKADKVAENSKTEWDNIELKKGETPGTYKAVFSAGSRKTVFNVKPVLEGKDFQAAEKLYQEKLQEYTRIQAEREKTDKKNDTDNKNRAKDNKRIEELNKLVMLRNRFVEAENTRIDALNNANKRRMDSVIKAKKDQQVSWEQANRTAALEQNLIRSFKIDGFGYWNCDQPTLPQTEQYVSSFTTRKNEAVIYNTLCIAAAGINRIQNYYSTKSIGLIPAGNYFGWAFTATKFYYFTKEDFKNALVTKNPNTIAISMTLYEGDVKNYNELKGYLFRVNNRITLVKNSPVPRLPVQLKTATGELQTMLICATLNRHAATS